MAQGRLHSFPPALSAQMPPPPPRAGSKTVSTVAGVVSGATSSSWGWVRAGPHCFSWTQGPRRQIRGKSEVWCSWLQDTCHLISEELGKHTWRKSLHPPASTAETMGKPPQHDPEDRARSRTAGTAASHPATFPPSVSWSKFKTLAPCNAVPVTPLHTLFQNFAFRGGYSPTTLI